MTRRSALLVLGSAAIVGLRGADRKQTQVLSGEDLLGHESVRGYASVLQTLPGAEVSIAAFPSPYPKLCVVPAGRALSRELCGRLAEVCKEGCTVLLEHPTPFSDPGPEQTHAAFQQWLTPSFDVQLQPCEQAKDLYIEFRWPKRCLVRRFGTVHAVTGGHPIAFSSSCWAGVSKPFGKGRLICISAVLGPQLLSGDVQAREWFASVVSQRCV